MALARAFEPEKFALQQPERARPLSRVSVVCAVVLALLTGLTAGQLGRTISNDFDTHSLRPSGRAALLASAYYDAVNAHLSGKAPSDLDALIAADYSGHPDQDGIDEGKDQFLTRLAWFADAFPLLRIRAELVSTTPDLAVMRVSFEGTGGAHYEGIPIDFQSNQTAIEILRFDDDVLVEQWSHVRCPGQYELLGSMESFITTGGVLQPRLERIELQVGGRMALDTSSAHLLLIESGGLTIEGTGGPSRTAAFPKGESSILFAGSVRSN